MRVELGGGCTRAAAAIAKGSGWKGSGSFTNLAALAAAADREASGLEAGGRQAAEPKVEP